MLSRAAGPAPQNLPPCPNPVLSISVAMYQREPRSYSYADQNTAYPSSHVPHQSGEYTTQSYQAHDNSHYYVGPAHGISNANDRMSLTPPAGALAELLEATHSSSAYYRSLTPSPVTNRYPNSGRSNDSRYHSSQGYGSPTSSASLPMYGSQNHQYPAQYMSTLDQRSHPLSHAPHPTSQFIPTPSEMAHSYSSYSHQAPHSPTIPEDPYSSSSLSYPSPPHIFPSSRANHSHLPSRIATGRPRTGSAATSTSPTSTLSPSGERFPCEKCGKTFSRSHDRKRHNETQHTAMPIMHTCQFCQKEFSR